MATEPLQKLEDEAIEALKPLQTWLPTAPFRPFENYELCDDNEGLVNNAREFTDCFTPTIKVQHLRICYNWQSG